MRSRPGRSNSMYSGSIISSYPLTWPAGALLRPKWGHAMWYTQSWLMNYPEVVTHIQRHEVPNPP